MCFDQKSSLGFALSGAAASWWIYSRTNNYELARGVFFFFLMEFLQFLQVRRGPSRRVPRPARPLTWRICRRLVTTTHDRPQYFVIAPDTDSPICDSWLNQFLTLLGFLHICLQPFFCHSISASLVRRVAFLPRSTRAADRPARAPRRPRASATCPSTASSSASA